MRITKYKKVPIEGGYFIEEDNSTALHRIITTYLWDLFPTGVPWEHAKRILDDIHKEMKEDFPHRSRGFYFEQDRKSRFLETNGWEFIDGIWSNWLYDEVYTLEEAYELERKRT